MNMIKHKAAASSTAGIIGFVIAIILLVGVAIPITQTVINDGNLTGITATIVGFIPVFLGIGGLVLASKMFGGK